MGRAVLTLHDIRNIDHHQDMEVSSIEAHIRTHTKSHCKRAKFHLNTLVVKLMKYSYKLNVKEYMHRKRNILTDLINEITSLNVAFTADLLN